MILIITTLCLGILIGYLICLYVKDTDDHFSMMADHQDTITLLSKENEKLQKQLDLMNYQLKVQDRIIEEYEKME